MLAEEHLLWDPPYFLTFTSLLGGQPPQVVPESATLVWKMTGSLAANLATGADLRGGDPGQIQVGGRYLRSPRPRRDLWVNVTRWWARTSGSVTQADLQVVAGAKAKLTG